MRSAVFKTVLMGAILMLILLSCSQLNNLPFLPPMPPTATLASPSAIQASPTGPAVSQPGVQALSTPAALPLVASPGIVAMDMLDLNNGWALSDSAVLRTTDGGQTWNDATPSGVSSVGASASSYFMTASSAWVLIANADGTTGSLYRTTDGGSTWATASVPFAGASLQFLDAANGIAMASLGAGAGSEAVAVYHSSDGGSTWTQAYINDPTVAGSGDSLPLAGTKSGAVFLDSNHGWVSGAEPMPDFIYLYGTADGGHTWTQQNLALPSAFSGATTNADPPRFFSASQGVLAVDLSSYTVGTVFYLSRDGGVSWTPTQPVTPTGRYSIASLTDFFVWDGGSTLFVSHDSGQTWSSISPNINVQDSLVTFQFVDPMNGWTLTIDANNHSSLYKTADGGQTWTTLIP